jgi:hypothetical protein
MKWWLYDFKEVNESDHMAEQREWEIQQLAKKIFKDYNGFEFKGK